MNNLTEEQQDALAEICNVGMSKAAKQLSILLDSEVKLSIPKIQFYDKNKYSNDSSNDKNMIMASVSQTLKQDFIGSSILMFDRRHSSSLVEIVIGKPVHMKPSEVRACEREAMLEIGNIIISSCISAMVNMLNKTVILGLPTYGESSIENLLMAQLKNIDDEELQIFMISTRLQTDSQDFSGNLLLILSMNSIREIINAINEMLSA